MCARLYLRARACVKSRACVEWSKSIPRRGSLCPYFRAPNSDAGAQYSPPPQIASPEPLDGYGELERRVRRRLGDSGAVEALVGRCRERGVTAEVVAGSTCAEVAAELGVPEEAARALF